MTSTEVREKLKTIFEQRFNVIFDSEILMGQHLLGRQIGLEARDLIYLYFDIEQRFTITIPQEAVVQKKLSTFNKICEMIMEQLTYQYVEVSGAKL